MPSILVTGASGFIGAALCRKLIELGFTVKTFGRQEQAPAQLKGLEFEHCRGDVLDPESIESALSGCGAVFHLAGLVSYKRRDYELLHKINVIGTRNVMKACLDAGIERVIHMGSIAGMGIPEPGTIGDESIEYNLKGHGLYYCDTKHEGEQEAMRFAKQGLPVLCLNPGITFGEGDSHPHHHAIFKAMLGGWVLGYPGGGVMFTDIDDLVGACLSSLVKGDCGQRYVIGSANLSFKEAADKLALVLNGRRPNFQIPGFASEAAGLFCEFVFPLLGKTAPLSWQVAWLSQRRIFFSSQKAIEQLGLKQTEFVETLRRTAPFYLGKELFKNEPAKTPEMV